MWVGFDRYRTVDCKPISARDVGTITTGDITPIVRPCWNRGRETTALRLLNRIEMVFDYAEAMEWRKADNPATWPLFQTILQATGPTGPNRSPDARLAKDARLHGQVARGRW